jgi:hypothetical protein
MGRHGAGFTGITVTLATSFFVSYCNYSIEILHLCSHSFYFLFYTSMAKLTARKNARRSGKAKENCRQSPVAIDSAQSRPRPKPRPTGKAKKLPQDSTVLSNTSNTPGNDPEIQIVVEALVSMGGRKLPAANAPPVVPVDWHYRVVSNTPQSHAEVPLVVVSDSGSDLEDSDDNNDDEIDQLESDNSEDEPEDISKCNVGMSIPIRL